MSEKIFFFVLNHLWQAVALVLSAGAVYLARRWINTRARAQWLEQLCDSAIPPLEVLAKSTATKLDDIVLLVVKRVEAWAEQEGHRLSELEREAVAARARLKVAAALPESIAVAVGNAATGGQG